MDQNDTSKLVVKSTLVLYNNINLQHESVYFKTYFITKLISIIIAIFRQYRIDIPGTGSIEIEKVTLKHHYFDFGR